MIYIWRIRRKRREICRGGKGGGVEGGGVTAEYEGEHKRTLAGVQDVHKYGKQEATDIGKMTVAVKVLIFRYSRFLESRKNGNKFMT